MIKYISVLLKGPMISMKASLYTMFITAILLFSYVFFPNTATAEETGEGDEDILDIGELVVTNTSAGYKDTTLILNGNLTIEKDGKFTLVNCTMAVNSTSSVIYSIHVKEGGSFVMNDSIIRQLEDHGYGFIVEGTIITKNCTISGTHDPSDPENSGIIIRSDNVTMNDTVVQNWGSYSRGLFLDNASPMITNSIISAQYRAVELVNGSNPTFLNTTITSIRSQGSGIICVNSSFKVQDCTFTLNSLGIQIDSGKTAEIIDCNFTGNMLGILLRYNSSVDPVIRNCTFSDNQLCAIVLYGTATIDRCTFTNNVVPGLLSPVASVILMRAGENSLFTITNSTFRENHNGILVNNVSANIENCTFENNTLFGGYAGIIVYGPLNNSMVKIEGCTVSRHPVGADINFANQSSGFSIQGNAITGNELGIRIVLSTVNVTNNEFRENDCAVEDRYSQTSGVTGNSYENDSVARCFYVSVSFLVKDGYNVSLDDAELSLDPHESVGDYSQELTTNHEGRAASVVKWTESLITDGNTKVYSYHPYTVTASYQGATETIQFDDFEEDSAEIIVPFQRPDLKVLDLEIEHRGFSVWESQVREDEKSHILFTVRNEGQGEAVNATVVVRVGNRNLKVDRFSLKSGDEKDFKVSWVPGTEGKINISVKVSHSDELNATENSLISRVHVGDNQRGYYYLIIVIAVLVISALIWWMTGRIEGADEDMVKITRNLRIKLANIFDSWARKLRVKDADMYEETHSFIPVGDIYSWDGEPTLSGSGKCHPWMIENENNLIEHKKKKDIITLQIKVPPPEVEMVIDEGPEMETFEWVTSRGRKESIQVDKRTLIKISHPKMYICSLCDRNFVSVEGKAKCPWCTGKAIFLQDM